MAPNPRQHPSCPEIHRLRLCSLPAEKNLTPGEQGQDAWHGFREGDTAPCRPLSSLGRGRARQFRRAPRDARQRGRGRGGPPKEQASRQPPGLSLGRLCLLPWVRVRQVSGAGARRLRRSCWSSREVRSLRLGFLQGPAATPFDSETILSSANT